jgi:long-subunit acyl-CoA synthetase (AMP-forming)
VARASRVPHSSPPPSRSSTSVSTSASASRHAIVPDAWAPGEMLTPTMKLRRRAIVARYGDVIEQLYA